MSIFRLYVRVLALLGSESRLAWALALANMALASAQFAEPVVRPWSGGEAQHRA